MNADNNVKSSEVPTTAAPCILIVNDDEDALFLLVHGISRAFAAARLLTASNGTEALVVWKKETLHAIVTDNRMPQMTGMMLTRKIRETDSTLPIIMVTGSIQDRAEALEAGVTVFHTQTELDSVVRPLKTCLGLAQSNVEGLLRPR